ncbi:hypothetical protein [Intestinibacter sp.]
MKKFNMNIKKMIPILFMLIVIGNVFFKNYRREQIEPCGLYVDLDENFYVAVQDYKKIKKFNNQGGYVDSIELNNDNVKSFYVDSNRRMHIIYMSDNKYYDGIFDLKTNKTTSSKKIDKKTVDEDYSLSGYCYYADEGNKVYSLDRDTIITNDDKRIVLDKYY